MQQYQDSRVLLVLVLMDIGIDTSDVDMVSELVSLGLDYRPGIDFGLSIGVRNHVLY